MADLDTASTTTLDVVEWASGEVVHSVNVAGKSERQIDAIERGMLRNMDRDRFGVRASGDSHAQSGR